jgi:uncharacterized membrane protein YdjX (TVP38/TMEM64 family)
MKDKKIIFQFIFFILVLALGIIFLWKPITNFLSNPDQIKEFVHSFGIFAPLIFVLIVIIQVIFAPIPGQITGLAGGYLFGPLLGTIYGSLGLMIGSFIVFVLARKLGRPFVERVITKKTMDKFDKIIKTKGQFSLLLIYFLPIFPDDAISYLAGLTKIKMKNLVFISTLGRLPGILVLSLIGAGIASKNSIFAGIIFGVTMVLSILIYVNRNRLEKLMIKITKRLKKSQ